MGDSWNLLHLNVRSAHWQAESFRRRGIFTVRHGKSLLARIALLFAPLPPECVDIPTTLEIVCAGSTERWTRWFGTFRMVTFQWSGNDGSLIESTGRVQLAFSLIADNGSLRYQQRYAAFRIGSTTIPLPRWLAPNIAAMESPAADGGTMVHVEVTSPLIGLLAVYEGQLFAEESS